MKQITKTFFALGTANSVSVFYDENDEEEIEKTLEYIKSYTLMLDDMFSVFKEKSEITKINNAAGSKTVEVSRQTYTILEKAVEFSRLSSGAFDITAGPVAGLWRNAIKGTYVPDKEDIEKQRSLTNYKDIILEDGRAGLSKKGQQLDLGGIAKGFAADEAAKILNENEIKNAIVNFGGTIIILGGEKRVGIQNPDMDATNAAGFINVDSKAVVTSGSYERYFIKDWHRYHHIIDPTTGEPSESGLVSVTVVGDCALEMDALSTAVFILGMKKGSRLIKKLNAQAVFIDDNRNVFTTKGISFEKL